MLQPLILKFENFENRSEKAVYYNYGSGDNLILSENSLLIPVENSLSGKRRLLQMPELINRAFLKAVLKMFQF